MSEAVKSALLSALVFPGAGQVYLKRYITAGLIIITSIICLIILTMEAMKQVQNILKEIEASGALVSLNDIVQMSSQAASNANTPSTSTASILIGICWLIGIADAYRWGKKKDAEQNS